MRLSEVAELETDGIWYLASPYTRYPQGPEAAFVAVSALAGLLLSKGVHIFCPIAHSHPMSTHGGVPHDDYEVWKALDRHFCDLAAGCLVAMLPGWQNSTGVSDEVRYFVEAGKPIVYLEPPALKELVRRPPV